MPAPFTAYELRTTDVEGARRFYTELLGHDDLRITPLPERARAAGAPAHWLGHIGVEDPDEVEEKLLARGAEKKGPALRMPGGEMIALDVAPAEGDDRCLWHELHSRDADAAWTLYSEVFGWKDLRAFDIPDLGRYRVFAFNRREAGGMISSANAAGRHTHWLFYYGVRDLDATIARARALGALAVVGPETFGGTRVAALDDPQGAAFGLRQIP
jgi:predicted enzyme related to lactoylglutathione lyase